MPNQRRETFNQNQPTPQLQSGFGFNPNIFNTCIGQLRGCPGFKFCRHLHVFRTYIHNNGYSRGLGLSVMEMMFSSMDQDLNLTSNGYDLLENSILPILFNDHFSNSTEVYNNGYSFLGLSFLFSEDTDLSQNMSHISLSQNMSHITLSQNISQQLENQEEVNPDFINRLEKFQTFLEANMVIFQSQFQLFLDQGGGINKLLSCLGPFCY